MSGRELTRVEVLSRVKAGTLSLKSAATLLAVSYRQAKRLARPSRTESSRTRESAHRGRCPLSTRGPDSWVSAARWIAELLRVCGAINRRQPGRPFGSNPTLWAGHIQDVTTLC